MGETVIAREQRRGTLLLRSGRKHQAGAQQCRQAGGSGGTKVPAGGWAMGQGAATVGVHGEGVW
jgi:hypothetical protein